MKRFLILFLLLCPLVCRAQETGAHLKFKGIPIDGNYESFAQKLIDKGFVQLYAGDDAITLAGTFMAESNVTVNIYPDPATQVVAGVAAMISTNSTWPSTEQKYREVVAAYQEKYGKPAKHEERFDDDPELDFTRMLYIMVGHCHYYSLWEVEGGSVSVYIDYHRGNVCITCAYIDAQNAEARRKAIIDDI